MQQWRNLNKNLFKLPAFLWISTQKFCCIKIDSAATYDLYMKNIEFCMLYAVNVLLHDSFVMALLESISLHYIIFIEEKGTGK